MPECLAKLHPEHNSDRAQCPLAAGKNKPQMDFDAAAGATSPLKKHEQLPKQKVGRVGVRDPLLSRGERSILQDSPKVSNRT